MGAKKDHSLNVRVTEEEYGWIMRYAERSDQSIADVVRKAIRLYISAVAKSKQKQEQANEAKGNLFVEGSETTAGNGVQANRDIG